MGGGSGNPNPPTEQATSASTADNSGPLEERLVSKNWSVRANAFDELANAFKMQDNPNDMLFKDHSVMWKKYLADGNPGALEKCLDSFSLYMDRAHPKVIAETKNEAIKVLIEKSMGQAKPTIK